MAMKLFIWYPDSFVEVIVRQTPIHSTVLRANRFALFSLQFRQIDTMLSAICDF